MPWAAPSTSDALSRLALFSQVSPDHLDVIAAGVQRVRLGRGVVLFHRGEPCTGFFAVLRGRIKLAITSAEGNEKVLEIIGPGESFAEAAMFADRPFPVTASALEPADLLAIPRQAVGDLLDRDPTFARTMIAGLSVRLHTMVADVGAMALHTGTQRVIGFLLGEAGPRAGRPDGTPGVPGGPVGTRAEGGRPVGGDGVRSARVRLPVGKAVLASRLSITPETFSRVLRLLAEQGLVTVEGRDVVLHDLARLAEYSGG